MCRNKVNIVFIICCCFTVTIAVDTTADERTRVCTGVAVGKTTYHPYDYKKYIECTSNPLERTCISNACFDRISKLCSVDACPKPLTPLELKSLCLDQESRPIYYPGNNTKFIFCLAKGALLKECGIKNCFDVNTGCNNEACFKIDQLDINTDIASVRNDCKQRPWLELVADKNNCEYYYTCLGKDVDPVYMPCPANLHFSATYQNCTNPVEAKCQFYTQWCKNKQNGIKFTAQNCYDYYECNDQETTPKSCLYSEHFDVDQGKCVRGMCINRDGSVRIPICTARDEGVYMTHPKCNKYYVCLNKIAVERQCLAGSYFDARLKICLNDANNNCNRN